MDGENGKREKRGEERKKQDANTQYHIITMCLSPSEKVVEVTLRRHSEVKGLDYIFHGSVCTDSDQLHACVSVCVMCTGG